MPIYSGIVIVFGSLGILRESLALPLRASHLQLLCEIEFIECRRNVGLVFRAARGCKPVVLVSLSLSLLILRPFFRARTGRTFSP